MATRDFFVLLKYLVCIPGFLPDKTLIFLAEDNLTEANKVFQKLTTLYNRITLLADLFSTTMFGHNRSGPIALPGFTGADASKILPELGALHRACIWENIVLKGSLAANNTFSGQNPSTQVDSIPSTVQANAVLNEPDTLSAIPGLTSILEGKRTAKESSKKESPQERNSRALKYIATQIPTSLTPFFQGRYDNGYTNCFT